MEKFCYYCPTEIIFGRGTEDQTAAYVRKHGGHRILLVYGGGSVVKSGLLDRICRNLDQHQITWSLFGGVKANPTLQHAREGVAAGLAFQTDFILGVGGGSAIDTAKAIAHGVANPETDIWNFWDGSETVQKSLPVGVVLTIPAAGSETSSSAVLTNTEISRKRGLSTDFNRPVVAIMNPELTYTLPPYQIACGITDIMMHTLDRYFNPIDNEMTDAIAEALLRTTIASGRAAMQDSHDYAAMSELMWAGSLSHNGLTGLGGQGDFAIHQLGHELSATFDTAHGASLATVWNAWARYVYQTKPSRFARYAKNVWGLAADSEEELALAGIENTVAYFAAIGMPTCFAENQDIGIQSETVLQQLAYRCSFEHTRTIGSFRILDEDDIHQIYKAANHSIKI